MNLMLNFNFTAFAEAELQCLVYKRIGETRIGENISTEVNSTTRFVILGIEEDIGPQTNGGNPGAKNAFKAALSKFVNMQSNRFLSGSEICIIGTVTQSKPFESITKGHSTIEELDELIFNILTPYFKQNLIPIVIGGGHNNAYPIIKSYYSSKSAKLDVINLDPHADCRPLEGRHSGNPFSYAKVNGYLNHYSVLGLHKAYNNSKTLSFLDQNNFFYQFFEDFIDSPSLFKESLAKVINQNSEEIGIELDLDAIKDMPSSAYTPSGFTIEDARSYIRTLAKSRRKTAYFHLPEGAPTNEKENLIIGKTISYLLHDFISCQTNY